MNDLNLTIEERLHILEQRSLATSDRLDAIVDVDNERRDSDRRTGWKTQGRITEVERELKKIFTALCELQKPTVGKK